MEVPSKSIFESFVAATTWQEPEDWIIRLRASSDLGDEKIKEMLRDIFEAHEKHWQDITAHDLMHWFQNQSNFMRGWTVGTRRVRKEQGARVDIFIENKLEYINSPPNKTALQRGDSHFEVMKRKLRLEMAIEWPGSVYVRMIAQSYLNYFHSNKWVDIAIKAKTYRKAISNACSALQALEKYENILANNLFMRTKDRLLSINTSAEPIIDFIKRNDATVKERGLVYDLALANYYISRRPMPIRIYHFLGIDGIANPLDQRTIERLVAKILTIKRSNSGLSDRVVIE